MDFVPFRAGEEFRVAHLRVKAVPVTHIVPTVGLVVTDGEATVAFSGDTAATEELWRLLHDEPRLDALLIESSFPNSLSKLAAASGHLTPAALGLELRKLSQEGIHILAVELNQKF